MSHDDHPDFDLDALLGPAPAAEASTRTGADQAAPSEPAPAMPAGSNRSPRRSRPDERRGLAASLAVFGRYPRVAGAVFVAVMAITGLATFLATPVYEARARVQIELNARRVLPFRPLANDEREMARDLRRNGGTRAGLRQLVRPRDLARRTLDDLDLWDEMAARAPAPDSDEDVPAAMRGPRGRATRAVLAGMRMSGVPRSRLIDFGFRATDPALAARVADGLASGFIALAVESRARKAREATAWLDEQVAELAAEVASAEQKLQRYREAHGAVAMRARGTASRQLIDLNTAATDARMARIEKEVLYRQYAETSTDTSTDASTDDVFDDGAATLLDPVLQQQRADLDALDRREAELAAKLGDRHPDLQAIRREIEVAETNLEAGMSRVAERARTEYDVALSQEREIIAALERQKAAALASDRAGIELRLLMADVEAARRIHASIVRRRDQIGALQDLSIAGMRVVDPAVRPSTPVYPRPWLNLLAGATVGLLLAYGVAGALHQWHRRRCTAETLQQHLGAAVLGVLPLQSASAFDEALNSLRTNLRFAVPEGRHVVTVTSAEPGEGKSTITAKLGAALARDGHRVLLVDADMRRPVLHDLFDVPAEPGLSNLLAGLATEGGGIVATAEEGLSVLPAGRIPPNPSELLLSERYRNLMRSFESRFDWVLIDAPPVLAVTDPVVLAQSATGFVFVVDERARNVRRLVFAVEQVRRVQDGLLGVVINRAAEGAGT